MFLELNYKRLYQSSGKGKESRILFTSSTKCEIRHLYVVVVHRRQRNVQKSVMHVQNCYFANLCLLGFSRSRCRRRRRCLSSLICRLRGALITLIMLASPWAEGILAEADCPTVAGKGIRMKKSEKRMYSSLAAAWFSLSGDVEVFCYAWLIERSRRCWLGRLLWWCFNLFFKSLCCIWRFSICVDRLRIASKFTEVDGSVDDGLELSVVSWTAYSSWSNNCLAYPGQCLRGDPNVISVVIWKSCILGICFCDITWKAYGTLTNTTLNGEITIQMCVHNPTRNLIQWIIRYY